MGSPHEPTEKSKDIETDYLIVGAGAAGMSFADLMLTKSDADMVLVDSRHAAGGHWLDAYSFARLHMPSACYGVDSMAMGGNGPDSENDEALFERASPAEICAYYDTLLQQRFLPSSKVRFLPRTEFLGDGVLRSNATGENTLIHYKKLVDATYLQGEIPATSPPPYEVGEGVRSVTPSELTRLRGSATDYVVIGAGKTGQDACLWLLSIGLNPQSIQWVRPRDP
ncbi:MAG: NAD(P)-binding protein [Alphaproteobacteria bacterium]